MVSTATQNDVSAKHAQAAFQFVAELAAEVSRGRVELPAYPDVATRVRKALADENVSPEQNTWLILRLYGTKSNRDGIGAVVQIPGQTNHMTTSVGYASSTDVGVHFGAGQRKQIERIDIRWPSGTRQTLRDVRTNQILQVRERDQGGVARDSLSRR